MGNKTLFQPVAILPNLLSQSVHFPIKPHYTKEPCAIDVYLFLMCGYIFLSLSHTPGSPWSVFRKKPLRSVYPESLLTPDAFLTNFLSLIPCPVPSMMVYCLCRANPLFPPTANYHCNGLFNAINRGLKEVVVAYNTGAAAHTPYFVQ